jgi:hypothetical protein
MISTAALPATRYCGTYSGTEGGKFVIAVSGGVVSGVAAQDGEPSAQAVSGRAVNSQVTLSWAWNEPSGSGSGSATGTISGDSVSGSWSNSLNHRGTGGGPCR